MLDGITIPKDHLFASDGAPIIENGGAAPDITVANEAAAPAVGHDRQPERHRRGHGWRRTGIGRAQA